MREKIALFCNLNSIEGVESYQMFVDQIEKQSYDTCIAYNTNDFFVSGIWDLHKHNIDEEAFFQIGDIGSERPIKTPRPHLDAVEKILSDTQSNTIYVIDKAAKTAYIHTHGGWDEIQKQLDAKGSTILSI